jgi:competence protein ComEC
MVACDVGQGDGLVLPAGDHRAVVIDSGPDPVAMDRCLDDLHITDVALVVFTHYHLDHVGGIVGVFHGRTVEQVVTGPLALPAGGVALVHSVLAAHHLTIGAAPIGSTVQVGDVRLDYLAPLAPFRGTRSDPNNSSVIIKATVDGERIMLPGDAEIEAQQSLLDSGVDVSADVLKVPHHGSAYSDPQSLAAVHAKVGVISVGAGNDYGLPSPVLLTQLAKLGVPVLRTDHAGDVAVVYSGGVLSTVARGIRASSVG